MHAADVIPQGCGIFELHGADMALADAGLSVATGHGLLHSGVQDVLDHFAVTDVFCRSASHHRTTTAAGLAQLYRLIKHRRLICQMATN